MDYWRFLCNAGTRPECLRRQLVGEHERRPVSPGDTILLYDYSENEIYGPMTALTPSGEQVDSDAWRGEYQYQVRVSWDRLYRISSSEFPQIESNETLPRETFEQIVSTLRQQGNRLVLPDWGSPEAAYAGAAVPEPDDTEIASSRAELEEQLSEDPPDPGPVEYADGRHIARSEAFRRAVREAYDCCCAMCGARRETPDGHPEVEAAHIFPKASGGPNDIRNGLALCRLHHWAFDNGWLGLTVDRRITVSDLPGTDGYDDFAPLDGTRLHLPDDARKYPAVKYIDRNP